MNSRSRANPRTKSALELTDEDLTYNVFVGDINADVTESDLEESFLPCGPIHSTLVFRDKNTKQPKGFGFVHFATKEGMYKALSEDFNHVVIKGRPCRVSLEQKIVLNVNNIPKSLGEDRVREKLYEILGVECDVELKTGPGPHFESRGLAYVTFGNHQIADKARKLLNKSSILNRPLSADWQEENDTDIADGKTVKVNDLDLDITDGQLHDIFSQCGPIVNLAIARDHITKESKGFAFVEYQDRIAAEKAVEELDGLDLNGKSLHVLWPKSSSSFSFTAGPKNSKKKPMQQGRSGGGGPGGRRGGGGGSQSECYRCGGTGHFARECSQSRIGGPSSSSYRRDPKNSRPKRKNNSDSESDDYRRRFSSDDDKRRKKRNSNDSPAPTSLNALMGTGGQPNMNNIASLLTGLNTLVGMMNSGMMPGSMPSSQGGYNSMGYQMSGMNQVPSQPSNRYPYQ